MNIKDVAKKWLIEHEHYEHESTFQGDLESLCQLITDAILHEGYIVFPDEIPYDSNFGDDKACECGHPYYRHFDTYDDMAPIGCKYCSKYSPDWDKEEYHGHGCCTGFKEKK